MDRKKTSEETIINGIKIKIVKDDITKQDTEAIVNAANSSLLGGGGVDGAIHKAGGPKILEECRKIHMKQGGCPTGKAVITTGGNLKAKYVIHTVGPIWHGGDKNESEFLRNCYINSLKLAREYNISSISFPSISTGAYGYPIEKACPVALHAIKEFSKTTQHNIKEIRFVLFTDSDFEVYKKNFEEIFKNNK